MGDLASGAMALAMIAAFVLTGFGVKFALKTETRKHGLLMIAAAAVLAGNVLVWTI